MALTATRNRIELFRWCRMETARLLFKWRACDRLLLCDESGAEEMKSQEGPVGVFLRLEIPNFQHSEDMCVDLRAWVFSQLDPLQQLAVKRSECVPELYR